MSRPVDDPEAMCIKVPRVQLLTPAEELRVATENYLDPIAETKRAGCNFTFGTYLFNSVFVTVVGDGHHAFDQRDGRICLVEIQASGVV